MGTDHAVGLGVLKTLVAALLVANLGFCAWSSGWLDGGAAARGDREPERLARQVRPESIRILAPGSVDSKSRSVGAPSAPAAASPPVSPGAAPASAPAASATASGEPTACLQSGPFTPAEAPRVEAALQAALPGRVGSWAPVKIEAPGIWLVYIGKFANRENLQQKMEELGRFRGLVIEEVRHAPEFEPGLALGRYDSLADAQAALAKLNDRGVRTAHVVALSPPATVVMLRVERVDPVLKAQLLGLPGALLAGASFLPCPPVVAGPAADSSAS
jgi:hypothetical protein